MRHIKITIWLILLALSNAFGQNSDVPYAPGTDGPGPLFSNKPASDVYPSSYPSLRKIDFKNFHFLGFDKTGKPVGSYRLKNGHVEERDEYGYSSNDLVSIHYLPAPAGSTEEAALVLSSWFAAGGSSSSGEGAEVFTLARGHLEVVQRISWDTHASDGQPFASFDPNSDVLVIRSSHYIPGDAHCCISAIDVVTFHWDGKHFVETNVTTELSEYGRAQGKTLPRINSH